MFVDLNVRVVTDSCFLGGFVGECSLTTDFVSEKIQIWLSLHSAAL